MRNLDDRKIIDDPQTIISSYKQPFTSLLAVKCHVPDAQPRPARPDSDPATALSSPHGWRRAGEQALSFWPAF